MFNSELESPVCIRRLPISGNSTKQSHQENLMSLLVVGSVAYDALETPERKVERTLGGAATYFSVCAAFFTHVNLVAIVGDDFDPKDEALLRKRSIDIEGLDVPTGKCFFWAGRYSENLNERVTLTTDLNVFAAFKPRLPEKYRNSKYVFLANIAPRSPARRPPSGQRHSKTRRHGHHGFGSSAPTPNSAKPSNTSTSS